jgi:hypothetical protein
MSAMVESLDEVFLRVKVVISISEREIRLPGNRAHRRLLITTLVENLQSSLKDQRFGLVSFLSIC